jgi:ABC-type transporter Mla MlaB component
MDRVNEKTEGVRVIGFAGLLRGGGRARTANGTPPEPGKSPDTVIVDLSGVAFLDQARLAVLLRFCADTRAGGCEVCLASLSGKARLQAQQTQLHHLVEIFNTVDEAIGALMLLAHPPL